MSIEKCWRKESGRTNGDGTTSHRRVRPGVGGLLFRSSGINQSTQMVQSSLNPVPSDADKSPTLCPGQSHNHHEDLVKGVFSPVILATRLSVGLVP